MTKGRAFALIAGSLAALSFTTLGPITPAQASNASVAVPNALAAKTSTVWVNVPAQRGQTIPVTFTLGAITTQLPVALNNRGAGTVNWTPTAPGAWTVSAGGATTVANVAAMPTEVNLSAASAIAVNTPTTTTATVSAASGNIAPTGLVTLVNPASGATLATGWLAANAGTATSSTTISWTPTSTGATALQARFTPVTGSPMAPAVSPTTFPLITQTAPIVTIQVPQPIYVGVPVTVTGITSSMNSGSMVFSANTTGQEVGLTWSVPIVNGQASFTWTPPVTGYPTLSVSFGGRDNNGNAISAVVSENVFVQSGPPADVVTVTPAGSGPLIAGQSATIRFGTPIAISSASQSGSPVFLNASGACAISGTVLFATTNGGSCTLTAFSPGSVAFDPSTQSYGFTVLKQAKRPSRR